MGNCFAVHSKPSSSSCNKLSVQKSSIKAEEHEEDQERFENGTEVNGACPTPNMSQKHFDEHLDNVDISFSQPSLPSPPSPPSPPSLPSPLRVHRICKARPTREMNLRQQWAYPQSTTAGGATRSTSEMATDDHTDTDDDNDDHDDHDDDNDDNDDRHEHLGNATTPPTAHMRQLQLNADN